MPYRGCFSASRLPGLHPFVPLFIQQVMGSWSTADEPRATEMALRKPEARRHSLQQLESPAGETEPSGGSHCTLWFALKFLLEPRSLCGLCEPTPLSSACVTRTLAGLPKPVSWPAPWEVGRKGAYQAPSVNSPAE